MNEDETRAHAASLIEHAEVYFVIAVIDGQLQTAIGLIGEPASCCAVVAGLTAASRELSRRIADQIVPD